MAERWRFGRRSVEEGWIRKSRGGMVVFFFLFLFLSPAVGRAEESAKKFDLSAAFRYSIPIGKEESGLKWSDLYDHGLGGMLEISYRATPRFAIHLGAADDTYKAKRVSGRIINGKFNDQRTVSYYLGVKGYLLSAALPQESGGINPYLRADVGVTQFNGASLNGVHNADRSLEFAYAVGGGVDSLTRFIVFFEARYENHGKPDRAAGALQSVPVSLGLRFLF